MFKLFAPKSLKNNLQQSALFDYIINFNCFRVPVFANMGHQVNDKTLQLSSEDYKAVFKTYNAIPANSYTGRVSTLFSFMETHNMMSFKSYNPVVATENYAYQDVVTHNGDLVRFYSLYWQKRRMVYVLNGVVKIQGEHSTQILHDFSDTIIQNIKLKAV